MRKGQEKIIESAKKHGYSNKHIEILSREDLTIKDLNFIFQVMNYTEDKEDDWIVSFMEIKDPTVQLIVFREVRRKHNEFFTAINMKSMTTIDDFLTFFSKQGVVCKTTFDVDILLEIGYHRYTQSLIKLANSMREVILPDCKFVELAELEVIDTIRIVQSYITDENFDEFIHGIDVNKLCVSDKSYLKKYNYEFNLKNRTLDTASSDRYCEELYTSIRKLHDVPNCRIVSSVSNYVNETTISIIPEKIYQSIYKFISAEKSPDIDVITINTTEKVQKFKIKLFLKVDGTKYMSIECFAPSNKILIKNQNEWNVYYTDISKTILIYNSNAIFTVHNNNYYPTTVSDIKCFPDKLRNHILSLCCESKIWKDFVADSFFPPVKLNDLSNYYNKADFFAKHFNFSVPKSVNKTSFHTVYGACCATKFIKPEQIKELLLCKGKGESFICCPNKKKAKQIAKNFLIWYFSKEKGVLVNQNTLIDYIEFAMALNEPIDIKAGKKKLISEHNRLALIMQQRMNRGKKLIIPETPLKYLKLPKEFILLQTKKALFLEGKRNCNCVGTYVDRINIGKCVIFSADINDEHLTIEVRCKKERKKYVLYVAQCYTHHNSNCKPASLAYVKKCVADSTDSALKEYSRREKTAETL